MFEHCCVTAPYLGVGAPRDHSRGARPAENHQGTQSARTQCQRTFLFIFILCLLFCTCKSIFCHAMSKLNYLRHTGLDPASSCNNAIKTTRLSIIRWTAKGMMGFLKVKFYFLLDYYSNTSYTSNPATSEQSFLHPMCKKKSPGSNLLTRRPKVVGPLGLSPRLRGPAPNLGAHGLFAPMRPGCGNRSRPVCDFLHTGELLAMVSTVVRRLCGNRRIPGQAANAVDCADNDVRCLCSRLAGQLGQKPAAISSVEELPHRVGKADRFDSGIADRCSLHRRPHGSTVEHLPLKEAVTGSNPVGATGPVLQQCSAGPFPFYEIMKDNNEIILEQPATAIFCACPHGAGD